MDETEPPLPSTSTAPVSLDLRQHEQRRGTTKVALRASVLKAGLYTHVCPQCGINPPGQPVRRTFQYVPPWVFLGLFIHLVVLGLAYFFARRRMAGVLALCADCAAADRGGRRLRKFSLLGLGLFPVVLGLAASFLPMKDAAIAGGLSGLVAGVVGIVAARVHTRFDVIRCRFLDRKKDLILLTASKGFAAVVARDAPGALR
jgi:hypothetical protein